MDQMLKMYFVNPVISNILDRQKSNTIWSVIPKPSPILKIPPANDVQALFFTLKKFGRKITFFTNPRVQRVTCARNDWIRWVWIRVRMGKFIAKIAMKIILEVTKDTRVLITMLDLWSKLYFNIYFDCESYECGPKSLQVIFVAIVSHLQYFI